MADVSKYTEFLKSAAKFVAALGAALGVTIAVTADGDLSVADIAAILTSFGGAGAVYGVKNKR